jgi:TnpA family transposase
MPTYTINTKVIIENWDEILRLITTIKLKRTTASTVLSRLNSYSKKNKLYRTLKEFGKIIKSIFILRYIDNVELRQGIEGQLSLVENSNKFSKAALQENEQSFV